MLLDSASSRWKNMFPHPPHPSGKETGNKTASSLFTDGGEGGLATCFSYVRVDFQIRDYIPRAMQRAQPPLISCSASAVFFSLAVCGAPGRQCEQTWTLLFPPPSPTKRAVEYCWLLRLDAEPVAGGSLVHFSLLWALACGQKSVFH